MLQETIQKLNIELKNSKHDNIKPKRIYKKPEGITRELYSLIRGDKSEPSPILITDFPSNKYKTNKIYVNKKKKVRKWVLASLKHPDRNDNLELYHWQRVEDVESNKPYPFAKFNKQPIVPTFTSEDYDRFLVDPKWTFSQTLYLMELAKLYNINFTVMFDRWDQVTYGSKLDIEALKERYYNVHNAILKVKTPPGTDVHIIYYDAAYERKRKQQLINLWNRTPEQMEEEEYLIQELKKIETRKKERERRITQDLRKLISLADSNIAAQRYRASPDAFEFTGGLGEEDAAYQSGTGLSAVTDISSSQRRRLSSISQIKLEELSNASSLNYNHLDASSEETCSNYSNIQQPCTSNTSAPNQIGGNNNNTFLAPYPPSSKKLKSSPHVTSLKAVKNYPTPVPNSSVATSKANIPKTSSNKSVFHQLYQQALFDQSNFTGIKFPDYKSSGVYLRSNKMKLPISLGQKKTKAIEQALSELFNKKPALVEKTSPNESLIIDKSSGTIDSRKENPTGSSGLINTPIAVSPTTVSNNRYTISYYNHPYHPPATVAIVNAFNNLRNDIMLLYELKSALTATQQEIQYLKMYADDLCLTKTTSKLPPKMPHQQTSFQTEITRIDAGPKITPGNGAANLQ